MGKEIRTIMRVLVFAAAFLFLTGEKTTLKAAGSYTDAYEFYYSGNERHAEVYGGDIYYATKGVQASDHSGLKFGSVGYDVVLSGGGASVAFSVKRGGSMITVQDNNIRDGYVYTLHKIPRETILDLAAKKDPEAARIIMESPVIHVMFSAIMTTKYEDIQQGSLEEDGSGGVRQSGKIYHVAEESDRERLRQIFVRETFESFYQISCAFENTILSVQYHLEGGTVSNGYTKEGEFLSKEGQKVTTRASLMQNMQLVSHRTIGLKKAGYHTQIGAEWANPSFTRRFGDQVTYAPADIFPEITMRNSSAVVHANWIPNHYTVKYEANGGKGIIGASAFIYGQEGALETCSFTREGYHLTEKAWNTREDGTGIAYGSEQLVSDLTEEDGATVVLYAQWQPELYQVSLDSRGGTGGDACIYEKYENGWFKDENGRTATLCVQCPERAGYLFKGYHTGPEGTGTPVTDEKGVILLKNDYFYCDSTIYAHWEAKRYQIRFEKESGKGGSEEAIGVYGEEMPQCDSEGQPLWAPTRAGYSFRGYYTKKNGKGKQYYNEYMDGIGIYDVAEPLTLYAFWVDEQMPDVKLYASSDTWTNRKISLTVQASDPGTGLSTVQLWSGGNLMAEKGDLRGQKECVLVFQNPDEGIHSYHAVAIDLAGNSTESSTLKANPGNITDRTVYSDRTAPHKVAIVKEQFIGRDFSLDLISSDANVK